MAGKTSGKAASNKKVAAPQQPRGGTAAKAKGARSGQTKAKSGAR